LPFYLYGTKVVAWLTDDSKEWQFDIGRATNMNYGQVVNYFKRMLPSPEAPNLTPEFIKTKKKIF